MATAGVTEIDKGYLTTLKGTLQDVLNEVNSQLHGSVGNPVSTATTFGASEIKPLNELQVAAGATGFDAASELATALKTMGGSVYDQLQWLQQVLQAMISETDQTIQAFGNTETLNSESVTQLQDDFAQTISLMSQGPTGSGGPGGGQGAGVP